MLKPQRGCWPLVGGFEFKNAWYWVFVTSLLSMQSPLSYTMVGPRPVLGQLSQRPTVGLHEAPALHVVTSGLVWPSVEQR